MSNYSLPISVDQFQEHPLRGVDLSGPANYAEYYEDFQSGVTVADKFFDNSQGIGFLSQQAGSENGIITMFASNGATDFFQLQQSLSGGAAAQTPWMLDDRPLSFMTNFIVNNANSSVVIVGLAEANNDLTGTVQDGAFFRIAGSATLEFVSIVGGVETTLPIATSGFVNLFLELGFRWNGANAFEVYRRSTTGIWGLVGTLAATPTTDALAVSYAIETGSSTVALSTDYVYATQERAFPTG